ncbi:hypothetical protein Gpo141_00001787 [Globisporangium polare]
MGWRGFQAQLLQCWVAEAIAHVFERFSATSSSNRSVALLSLLSNEKQQQAEDAAAFANISAFVKQFLRTQRTTSGGECSGACGSPGGDRSDELCVVEAADVGEFKLWLQSRHEQISSQDQHSDSSCLVVLYAPLLPVKAQEEIAQIAMASAATSSTRTLVLLINDPIGLMDVTSADSSSSSSCYQFIGSHAQSITDEPSSPPATASLNSYEQYLARPLKQLGVQCGLRFVMEVARWTVFASEDTSGGGGNAPALRWRPPPMLVSISQMPFQLLLLALRWSHFHPTLVRAFAKPFERKLRLTPQDRIRSAIFELQEQEVGLWSHLYAAEEPHDRQLLSAPTRRLIPEAEIISPVVQIPDSLGNEEEKDLDLKRRLSQCYLWDVQKQFYLAQGIKAWSDGIIPFGVSSSSFLAAAYARVAVDFFVEASDSRLPPAPAGSSPNEEVGASPNCFVWEAASGSCKFLHVFLVHFYQLLDQQQELAVRGLRPCVVASDLSDQVLESRMEMACFEPFLRDGRLEFARFDTSAFVSVENRKQLLLKRSQRVWHVGRDGPVFLMGNYFLDSLRTDVFAVTRSPVNSGGGEAADLKVFEGRVDPHISSIADLELSFQQILPFEKPTYDDPFVNQVFLDVLGRLVRSSSSTESPQPSALILFPVEAIEFIRALVDSTANDEDNSFPVGIMIGDASFSFRDPIPSAFFNQQEELFEIPQLSPHPDCFCLPIDFETLRLFLKRLARSPTTSTTSTAAVITTSSQVASAIATDTFDVLYGRVCPQLVHDEAQASSQPAPVSSSLSQVAFAHEFASFTPSDCDLLWGMMGVDDGAAHFSLKTQLALLAQSAWDFDLFVVLQWTLMRFYRSLVQRNSTDGSSSDSEQLLRVQLIAIAKTCWRTYYVLDGDNDHELSLLQLCRWLYELDAHDEVIALLSHTIKTTPELEQNLGICYLLALAFFHTEDFWHALVLFRKCFAIAPKRIKFRRRIAQTLMALQKQKLQAGPGSGN